MLSTSKGSSGYFVIKGSAMPAHSGISGDVALRRLLGEEAGGRHSSALYATMNASTALRIFSPLLAVFTLNSRYTLSGISNVVFMESIIYFFMVSCQAHFPDYEPGFGA